MFSFRFMFKILLVILVFSKTFAFGAVTNSSISENSCQETEKWDFISSTPNFFIKYFMESIKSADLVESFQKQSVLYNNSFPEKGLFLNYWTGRILFSNKLDHIALPYFYSVLKNPIEIGSGIKFSALGCILKIHLKNPSIPIDSESISFVLKLANKDSQKKIKYTYFYFISIFLKQYLNNPLLDQYLQSIESLIKNSFPYGLYIQGLLSSKRSDYKNVINNLEPLLIDESKLGSLKSQVDSLNIILGRAYFMSKDYKKSVETFSRVSKNSNFYVDSLLGSSWAFFKSKRLKDALGYSINFQIGSFRNIFAPESKMIIAMSTYQLCQYQKSLESVKIFKREYKDSYTWLNKWSLNSDRDNLNLYSLVLKSLKNLPTTVPEKVISEWIRSPVFQSNQEELNLLLEERSLSKKYYSLLGSKIQSSPNSSKALARAKSIIAKFSNRSAEIEKLLISNIKKELSIRNEEMLKSIVSVAENNQLVEVEILNSATADISWLSQNKDYKNKVYEFENEKDKSVKSSGWKWGTIITSSDKEDAKSEVWEDEIGALKADIIDNCKNKRKFLEIKIETDKLKK